MAQAFKTDEIDLIKIGFNCVPSHVRLYSHALGS